MRTIIPLVLLGTTAFAQPALQGQWSEVIEWPNNGTHLMMLSTGKVLSWNEGNPGELSLWDPLTNTFGVATHIGYNVFCAGHAQLSDGRLLVTGGHIDSNEGLPNASIYDPIANTWLRLPDMNAGRWYPTNTALPDGDMLVIAGTDTAKKVGENRLPQVLQLSTLTWRDLTGAQMTLRTYPWMFVAPNGKVFNAGPDPVARYLDTSGEGQWTDVAPSLFGDRFAGSAVMYDDGKIMVCGGGEDFPTETVEVIDLNVPAPAFRSVQSMAQRRKQHNATLLPDGTVLVTGGSSGPGKNDTKHPVYIAELWDPVTETFTQLAPNKVFRGYHSSALLLQDGRVLAGGGDSDDFEIFSPPYLFKGVRPRITAVAEGIAWGQQFQIHTPDADRIAKVTMVKLGSSTHAFNVGQRIHNLSFTRGPGVLNVTAPFDRVEAQPGHFMLFILDNAGVPSFAPIVKLSPVASPVPGVVEDPFKVVTRVPSSTSPSLIVSPEEPPEAPNTNVDGDPKKEPVAEHAPAAEENPGSPEPSRSASCTSAGAVPGLLPLLLGLGWALRRRTAATLHATGR